MRFDLKKLVHVSLMFILFCVFYYFLLYQSLVRHIRPDTLKQITTNFYCYYDFRSIAYIFGVIFLLFRNLTLYPSNVITLLHKDRYDFTKHYVVKLCVLSFIFVLIHGGVAAGLNALFLENNVLMQQQFYILALIYACLFFLYLNFLGLLLFFLENFFNRLHALVLCIILSYLGFLLGKITWSPLFDVDPFIQMYFEKGLTVTEFISRVLRLIAVFLSLYLVNSIFIQRRDFL
ncbi:WxPxxD family membrane protein [Sporolactobacillus kofuensis]|uniref:WxPxxD family membrane protein n=1 Tax=Sporolactobacillus kofuensis TaxID=269672 RepID=A0ABW1WDW9_9BACL|nr:WxPxxD family membrane protein [Sporolactobacillus kofuensis]MCO7175011.1 WxPxxD family membrane protein [Sporolactobacillus kofuensis]